MVTVQYLNNLIQEEKMSEDKTQPQVEIQPTDQELMELLKAALTAGNFKDVAAISRKIDNLSKANEKAEIAAKLAALEKVKGKVEAAINKAIKPIIDSGELDAADGIWYSYNFEEQTPTLRLTKTAARAVKAAGGGGTGRNFDVSTNDLLSKYGSEEFKDGLTFQQAYESSTEKNWRYAIRTKLLKKDGVIS